MSTHEYNTGEFHHPTKRRIQRRHGACEPCRSSKTRCDGRVPCGACRSERRRQCPCEYSEKAKKLQEVTAEIRRRAESDKSTEDEMTIGVCYNDEGRHHLADAHSNVEPRAQSVSDRGSKVTATRQARDPNAVELEMDGAGMLHPLSVCATVEDFKRLKPARGYSAQVVSRCNGFEVCRHQVDPYRQREATKPSDLIRTSPSQGYGSPDLSEDEHEIRSLWRRLSDVDTMVGEGLLDRAWVELASLVWEVHVAREKVVRHEHRSSAVPAWSRLWSTALDLQAQLGITLGRPTSLILTDRPQSDRHGDPVVLEDSLEETEIDLYQYAHGVLGLDWLSSTAVRDFLERAHDILQHEPFYHFGLCTTDGHSAAVRDLHFKTHLLFMTIFCRMASLCDLFSRDLTNGSWSESPAAEIIRNLNLHQPRQKLAYCRKMFRSANFILESFLALHKVDTEPTGSNWIRCHSAYSAAVILGIAKLRHEVEWHATSESLKKVGQVFGKLSGAHPQCRLFAMAAERLQDLNSVKEPASELVRNKHTPGKNRKRGSPVDSHPGSLDEVEPSTLLHHPVSSAGSPTIAVKRTIDMVDESSRDESIMPESFVQMMAPTNRDFVSQSETGLASASGQLGYLFPFEDNSASYSQSNTSFDNHSSSGTATSFSEPEVAVQVMSDLPFGHPGPPFIFPFPHDIYHPPMAWNNAMYGVDNPGPPPGPARVPLAMSFGPGVPPLGSKTSVCPSRRPSPLHPSLECSMVPTQLQAEAPTDPRVAAPGLALVAAMDTGSDDSGFMSPVKTPLSSETLSVHSPRPPFNRQISDRASQHSPVTPHDRRQPTAVVWRQPAASTISHEMQPAPASDDNLVVSRVGRDEGGSHGGGYAEVPGHRSLGPCFPAVNTQASSMVLGPQLFPTSQVPYLTPGMLENHQIQTYYPPHVLDTYSKPCRDNPNQFPEQRHPVSIDPTCSLARTSFH